MPHVALDSPAYPDSWPGHRRGRVCGQVHLRGWEQGEAV